MFTIIILIIYLGDQIGLTYKILLINLIIFIAFNCPHHHGRHRRYVGTPSSRQLVILIGNLQNIQIFYIGEGKTFSFNWTDKPSRLGSGCGTVGRGVASDTRSLRFESRHWRNLKQNIYILSTVLCRKKNKIKRPRMANLTYFQPLTPMSLS